VLIPVYDGLEETLECINSAIAARKLNRTPHRIVVLDDATPLPVLSKALKVLAAKGKIKLIQNPTNLGWRCVNSPVVVGNTPSRKAGSYPKKGDSRVALFYF